MASKKKIAATGIVVTDQVLIAAFAPSKKAAASKPRVRVRKPVAGKTAADTVVVEIDTATIVQAVASIPDAETLDQICERIAAANRKVYTL